MIRLIHRVRAYLLFAGLALVTASGSAEDFDGLVKRCEICHGEDGNSLVPIFPSISGFSYEGFIHIMNLYRENRRIAIEFQQSSDPDYVMSNLARQLSETDIQALAQHFTERPYIPRPQASDPELVSRGANLHELHCEQCHVENGTEPSHESPALAGQWTPYLRLQFSNIRSGKRLVPKRMAIRFKMLKPEDIEALLNFYASVN